MTDRRQQLDDALARARTAASAAGVPADVEPSELGLAKIVLRLEAAGITAPRDLVALATRLLAVRLGTMRPGRTVEVRVPPYAAVQVAHGNGPRHTRGTPPSVVEMDPLTFLRLATGEVTWAQAVAGHVTVSGVHADLSDVFPFG